MTEQIDEFLEHYGVKGMKWGVRREERPLTLDDKALNLSQRSQVKIASAVSALAAIGISSNAAAAAFQLQNRWEHLQMVKAVLEEAENNPLISDAGREALRATKNKMVKGLVASAAMTTAISTAIGVVTQRTAKAYFAPIHKTYGDAKPQINRDLRALSKDIKSGKRSSLTSKEYYAEVSKIVEKHMTKNRSNMLSPFHELARSQLGLEYDTKKLKISFSKLPNTDLYSKMTVTTPTGLVLVKAIRNVEHSALADGEASFQNLDLFFDYKFDSNGYVVDFSCPTIEIANDMFEGRFDVDSIVEKFGAKNQLARSEDVEEEDMEHSDNVDDFLAHYGIKGMKWGVRRSQKQLDSASVIRKSDAELSVEDLKKAPAGSVVSKTSKETGDTTLLIKNKDGSWEEAKISADAERFIKTHQKEGHEMSDREMREAINRAKMVKEYNEIFSEKRDPNGELKKKVDELQLKKQYGQLRAEMNPSMKARVAALIASSGAAYLSYKKLDKASNGSLSKSIAQFLNQGPAPKHRLGG